MSQMLVSEVSIKTSGVLRPFFHTLEAGAKTVGFRAGPAQVAGLGLRHWLPAPAPFPGAPGLLPGPHSAFPLHPLLSKPDTSALPSAWKQTHLRVPRQLDGTLPAHRIEIMKPCFAFLSRGPSSLETASFGHWTGDRIV